ncbi:26s proteasome non-atpase regulatory subunit, partial [Cystoisospora suis]
MANDGDRKLALIQAPSQDGAGKEKDAKKKRGTSPEKKKQEDDGLSEEDKKIKEDMELLVERLQDSDRGVVALALQTLSMELKAATSSMTSVPKPLKFLRPYIPVLVAHYQSLRPDDALKPDFAMMLAVLCTTCGDGKRRSLHFCLEAGCKDVESWGYEFMRNLAGEVASAYAEIHGEEKKAGAVDEEESSSTGVSEIGGGSAVDSSSLDKGKADQMDAGSKSASKTARDSSQHGSSTGTGAKKDTSETTSSSTTPPTSTTPATSAGGSGGVSKTKKPSPPAILHIPTMPTVPLPDTNALNVVVDLIVPFYMTHNAEVDAVDLLTEVERIEHITQFVDSNNYQRVSLYLLSMANYAASSEEFSRLLKVAFDILLEQKEWYDALRVALRLGPAGGGGGGGDNKVEGDQGPVHAVIEKCREDKLMLKQLALLLARQGVEYEFDDEQIQRLNTNEELSRFFLLLAKETDVLEPKTPEDVYKTYLEENPGGGGRRGPGGASGALDSAKQNLASTFVNAFVNAASCKDKLMLEDGGSWLYKNKDHGMMSAVASLGAILLWNIDEGLTHLDKYQYSSDAHIKAGALLGFGVLSSSVRHECDAAFALLKDRLEDTAEGGNGQSATCQKVGAVIGLGCAYAGTKRADVMESLTVLVVDSSLPVECSAFAALSLGLVFVGSCSQEAAEAIITTLLDRASVESTIVLERERGWIARGGRETPRFIPLTCIRCCSLRPHIYIH